MPLRIRGRSFRPRLWAFALAALFAAGGAALGHWQWERAAHKRAEQAARLDALRAAPLPLPSRPVAARDWAMRHVIAEGEFDARHTVLLDHRFRRGRPGYEVVTPLKLAGGARHVLVLRGWLPAGAPGAVPAVTTPAGAQRVSGLALETLPQWYEPGGAAPQGRIWQNLRIDAAQAALGIALQPIILEQHSQAADGLARDWPPPPPDPLKHEMYALQWYSLAALAGILWLVLSFRSDAPAAD